MRTHMTTLFATVVLAFLFAEAANIPRFAEEPQAAKAFAVAADGSLGASPSSSKKVGRASRSPLVEPALDDPFDVRAEYVRAMMEDMDIDIVDDDNRDDQTPLEELAEVNGPALCDEVWGGDRDGNPTKKNLREIDNPTWCSKLTDELSCGDSFEHFNGAAAGCVWNNERRRCMGVLSGRVPWSCGCPGIPAAGKMVCSLFEDKTSLNLRSGAKPRWCSQTTCDGAKQCIRAWTSSEHGRYVKCAWDANTKRCRGLGFSGAQVACCDHSYIAFGEGNGTGTAKQNAIRRQRRNAKARMERMKLEDTLKPGERW